MRLTINIKKIANLILPELQMGNFNNRLMLGFRRTVWITTAGGGIAAVVANSFVEWSMASRIITSAHAQMTQKLFLCLRCRRW